MTHLLNINKLAEILQRSPETIKRALRTTPDSVPPRVVIPGSRLLRWRIVDVETWIGALRTTRSKRACEAGDE